jgi:hypothetical protein
VKFKAGDRVVIVRDTLRIRTKHKDDQRMCIGYVDTVKDPNPFYKKWIVLESVNAPEEDLELECIYNSPLYKALE